MHAMRFGGFVRDEPAYHAARRRQTNLVVSSFKERRALEYAAWLGLGLGFGLGLGLALGLA